MSAYINEENGPSTTPNSAVRRCELRSTCTNGEVRVDTDNRSAIVDERTLLIKLGDVSDERNSAWATIGRAAPYLHDFKAIPDNHVTILRPKEGIDPSICRYT